MNLEITHTNNIYAVKGVLDKNSATVFKQQFESILTSQPGVTINIEGLKHIDKYGVTVLADMYKQSLAKNKTFAIVGFGCKDLYHHFKTSTTAH
ncbi:lipid asymmetry maintenance protein MlaB [Bizionia sediminis]|uniref:Lipid asymmetry maintenance protein MlaB n=1 Tax=Bizionia sediminis TaxID=1737064 RepID=A0ABW5KRR7_9FLAO